MGLQHTCHTYTDTRLLRLTSISHTFASRCCSCTLNAHKKVFLLVPDQKTAGCAHFSLFLLYDKIFLILPKVLLLMMMMTMMTTGVILHKMICSQVENGSLLSLKCLFWTYLACTKQKLNELTEAIITLGATSELVMAVMELQAASAAAFYARRVCDGLICTSYSASVDGSIRQQTQ